MFAGYNTRTKLEAGKYVSVVNCITDEKVNMKNIIKDNAASESNIHHIERFEVLHGSLALEEFGIGRSSDCLLKIILRNIEAISRDSSCS